MQKDIRGFWGDQAHVLPYILYCDSTELKRGGAKLWPVYMWVANMPLTFLQRRSCYRMVTMLPIVDADVLQVDERTARFVTHCCCWQ